LSGAPLQAQLVMPRFKRGIQYAAASPDLAGVSGILDHPLEPVTGRRDAPTRWRVTTALSAAEIVSR
jgi:hypothetical protein